MNNQDFIDAQRIWTVPGAVMNQIEQMTGNYKMKHGMFASVPIICKSDKCPYFNVCTVDPQYRINGTRCPMEISAIIARYETWCEHFGVSLAGSTISKEDVTDASLIRDLVDNEVQTIRAENKVAMDADFIGKTISQIDNKGKPYFEDTVNPASEYKMALQDKRYKIMQLLNSTRKDKASELAKKESFSGKAQSLLQRVKQALPNIDLDNLPDNPQVEVKKEGE